MPAISGASVASLQRSGSLTGLRPGSSPRALGQFDILDPATQHAYAEQANLEVEQRVGRISLLTASYQHVRGLQLAQPADTGASLCVTSSACGYHSSQSSAYNSVNIAFEQHPGPVGQLSRLV